MSFTSSYSTVLPASPSDAYEQLSGPDNFVTLLKLSTTCHLVELKGTEDVSLQWSSDPEDAPSQPLRDISQLRPSIVPSSAEDTSSASPSKHDSVPATRITFRMVERIPTFFGVWPTDVEVLGSQTFVPSLKMHIYSSVAGGGTVKVYKLRRFLDEEAQDGEPRTRVEEYIAGETSWVLRLYTESACRDAHMKHMNEYKTMIK